MEKINSNELLNQLQVLARKVQEANTQSTSDNGVGQSSQFSELMKDSINTVNDPDVPLSSLMIEMQKARVSFEALKQVRNQLVDAYKQVMNMPL